MSWIPSIKAAPIRLASASAFEVAGLREKAAAVAEHGLHENGGDAAGLGFQRLFKKIQPVPNSDGDVEDCVPNLSRRAGDGVWRIERTHVAGGRVIADQG